ncbi:hypothetical protein RQP46_003375 [Phenoliferia psychrophenolica]
MQTSSSMEDMRSISPSASAFLQVSHGSASSRRTKSIGNLKRTTNQARNRSRQTHGVSELMPMPDANGNTHPQGLMYPRAGSCRGTAFTDIRNLNDVYCLNEAQARAWLHFLDMPVPVLPAGGDDYGTQANTLTMLRKAVLDGFRGV